MKIQQNSLTELKKPLSSNKSFFKYKSVATRTKSQSSKKRNNSNSEYRQFIQGFNTSPFNELRPINQIFTEKQLAKISLFESVKRTKGEFYFKSIYQKSKYMKVKPANDLSSWFAQRKFFVYIISGHFNVYKYLQNPLIGQNFNSKSRQSLEESSNKQIKISKCYIRSYGPHEYFGYQQYPLYWKQKLAVVASVESNTFYKMFSGILNLAAIQLTAEFFKKLSVFRQVEMEKLLRMSTFSQRIRTYPNTVIAQKGEKIQHIILLYDGRISLTDKDQFYIEEKSGFFIGKKQFDLKKSAFDHQIKALIQCDIIVIPLGQFSKVSQIRHKLTDSLLEDNEKNIKSRRKLGSNFSVHENEKKYSIKTYTTFEQQIFKKNGSLDSLYHNKTTPFIIMDYQNNQNSFNGKICKQTAKSKKYRLKTAHAPLVDNTKSKSMVYDQKGRQFQLTRVKKSMNEEQTGANFFSNTSSESFYSVLKQKQSQPQEYEQKIQNITMGEICRAKFLNRKYTLENKQITKIINARLPESILNDEKEYTVIKPLIQKNSTYIKNYKRKIKLSQKINDAYKFKLNQPKVHLKIESQREMHLHRTHIAQFLINYKEIS